MFMVAENVFCNLVMHLLVGINSSVTIRLNFYVNI